MLVGIDRRHFAAAATPAPNRRRRTSTTRPCWSDRDGKIVGTYDKIHRVMFGEYIPFADWLPFLYRITPLTGGIEAGDEPAALEA